LNDNYLIYVIYESTSISTCYFFNQNRLATSIITFYFLVNMDMTGLHIISNSIVSDMTKMLVNVVWSNWSFYNCIIILSGCMFLLKFNNKKNTICRRACEWHWDLVALLGDALFLDIAPSTIVCPIWECDMSRGPRRATRCPGSSWCASRT
jgi:hypothetical protein